MATRRRRKPAPTCGRTKAETAALHPERTLDEVAEILGISRARCGQIEAMAIAKLRAELKRRGIGLEVLQ